MSNDTTKKKVQIYKSLPCAKCGRPRQDRPGRAASELCRACGKRPLADRFWDGVNFNGPIPAHRPQLGPCWISPYAPNTYGYPTAIVGGRGSPKKGCHVIAWFLHYGVWSALCILHLCDNRMCVRWDHLFEGTRGDNNRDCVAKDRNAFGERHPNSKLTADQVRTIRDRYAAGGVTQTELAEEFGAASSVVSRIVTGKIWRQT